jgi:hypothetical protein
VPDVARERILTEQTPERLERRGEQAIVADSLAEVLDGPSRARDDESAHMHPPELVWQAVLVMQ